MGWLKRFLLPKINRAFLIRIAILAVAAYVIFGQIMIPVVLSGHSMEPTYRDGRWNFCLRIGRLFKKFERGDVVCIRWAGRKRMLLKRIVAVEGETVEFRNGALFVDGVPANEPYVAYPCNWNLTPRKVEPGSVYVVGDNRSVPIEEHVFGQVSVNRIEGTPLW